MTSFITAYLIVWLAVAIYALRLGIKQRQLRQTAKALQQQLEQLSLPENETSKAA